MGDTDQNKDLEEAKRRDDVLKRMLSTKPQPHKTKQDEKAAHAKKRKAK